MLREPPIRIRRRGRCDYVPVWREMCEFTDRRTEDTPDEFWLVEHEPVYTLGQAGRRDHVLDHGDIPLVQSDRGGQVTYHGPGQAVLYTLVDLRRLGIGVRSMVSALEEAVIELCAEYGVQAARREGAPGVFVDGAKLAALGLRVRNGRTYHGLALNVAMDLEPFSRINPCGFPGLAVTQLSELGIVLDVDDAGTRLCAHLAHALGHTLEEQDPAAAVR